MENKDIAQYSDALLERISEITDKQGKIWKEDLEKTIRALVEPDRIEKCENIAYTKLKDGTRLDKSVGIVWHSKLDVVVGTIKGGERVDMTMNEVMLCETNNWKYSRNHFMGEFVKTIDSELMVDDIEL